MDFTNKKQDKNNRRLYFKNDASRILDIFAKYNIYNCQIYPDGQKGTILCKKSIICPVCPVLKLTQLHT